MAKLRVLLADDHAILRSGLQMLINSHGDYEVVAQASETQEAIDKGAELQPDVAIVDITMPGGGGVKVTEALVESSPKTRIIALTMHDDQAYLKAVLTAGASGFVVKRSADTRLLDAIETVLRGQVYIDPAMGQRVMQGLLDAEAAEAEEDDERHPDNLSLRERQVLTLLAHGYTNREAAERLGLSMRSVETYRSRMAEKLGFQSRVDLVRYALETGLLKSGEPL
ncbi:MAG: response regulator transcription factor [Alphaproteobacteria bacterium]|nr:response regulator transcription factor [Alphaproteobacteria bacterium]